MEGKDVAETEEGLGEGLNRSRSTREPLMSRSVEHVRDDLIRFFIREMIAPT